ncbi:hydrolase [Rossellomorea aquimaris]|uniref:hydrolase n=1 Tax=Rossellomorea aquimaris TaxID=189382 RepID=UPI001CD49488|nr:hydrolase [Rossellomorea aquimaris]MCA1056805.1 hydrolase [Rossellomorea aquimaris]
MDERHDYYIEIATGEISRSSTDSPWNFKISATDEEITRLREIFDSSHSVDWQNFYRAHVPYIQYHFDRQNDAYDENLRQVYSMIHDLGDEEAKKHIESMRILDEDTPRY